MAKWNRYGWLLLVGSPALWACLPLVDGGYVGEPLYQVSGTVDFADVPGFPVDDALFDLALLWTPAAAGPGGEGSSFVSVSRTESLTAQSAGTFVMDLFTFPSNDDGAWSGRLYAFVAADGGSASWTETWSPGSGSAPSSVVLCDSVIAMYGSPGAEGDSAADGAPLDDGSVRFFEQPEDSLSVAAWRSCVDAAGDRFLACQRESAKDNGEGLEACEEEWRAERDEVCGDAPGASGAMVYSPLSLRCRDSVEDVPFHLHVDLSAAEASLP